LIAFADNEFLATWALKMARIDLATAGAALLQLSTELDEKSA